MNSAEQPSLRGRKVGQHRPAFPTLRPHRHFGRGEPLRVPPEHGHVRTGGPRQRQRDSCTDPLCRLGDDGFAPSQAESLRTKQGRTHCRRSLRILRWMSRAAAVAMVCVLMGVAEVSRDRSKLLRCGTAAALHASRDTCQRWRAVGSESGGRWQPHPRPRPARSAANNQPR